MPRPRPNYGKARARDDDAMERREYRPSLEELILANPKKALDVCPRDIPIHLLEAIARRFPTEALRADGECGKELLSPALRGLCRALERGDDEEKLVLLERAVFDEQNKNNKLTSIKGGGKRKKGR